MMHAETGHYLHHVLELAYNYWHVTLFLLGSAMGGIVWAWNQYIKVFARHDRVNELESKNTLEHNEIKRELTSGLNEVKIEVQAVKSEILATILAIYQHDVPSQRRGGQNG